MKIPAWSYSSIKLFSTCPAKYEAERVTKEVPFTDSASTLYGKEMHKAAEDFVGSGVPLPPQFDFIKPVLDKLSATPGVKYCERKHGIAIREGRMVECDFFAPDVWFRSVADLEIVDGASARVVDYKTGNAKYADTKQLALNAAAMFLEHPEVQVIKGALVFLVSGQLITAQYERPRRFDIFSELSGALKRRETAYQTGVFNANPNGLCRKYCGKVSCPHNGANL